MRFVFLHNHIFKNAGSTVDHIFESAGFVNTRLESSGDSDTIYPRMVLEAVESDLSIEYLSSHVFRCPRPRDAENLGFIDIIFIRHPIDRLYSIYRYFGQEGVKDFPAIDKGASFAAFVGAISHVAPAHLHSPQTSCLGNERDFYFPPNRLLLQRAKDAIAETRFLGVVDLFDMSFQVFRHYCNLLVPGKNLEAFSGPFPTINRSVEGELHMEDKLRMIREQLGDERYSYIERTNAMDLELYRYAREELIRRHSLIAAPFP